MKKNIIVTGGAGFIGSEFVRQLCQNADCRVHVLDALTYAGDLARLESVKRRFDFYKVDIANSRKIQDVFTSVKPYGVIHFGAETHVDRCNLYSQKAVRTNVIGTQNLLNASRKSTVARFVYISTDEVYGEIPHGQFLESTPLNPSSPYSASKAAGDMLTSAYVRTYGFPAMIVRPSNNYGAWQYPEKLIPVVIYKALKGQSIPVYGKGVNVREWLHVSDCARAIEAVFWKGEEGGVYNIGSGHERKNIDVVKALLRLLDKPERLIEFVQDRPGHDLRYSTNYGKIQKKLGWTPQVSFDEGLKATVAFYKDHLSWLEDKVVTAQKFWKHVYKK